MWMKSGALHRFYGRHGWARRWAMNLRARMEFASLGGHKDGGVLRLIAATRRQRESLLSGHEAFLVHSLAAAQSALDGDMAEVGVYQGCSAKLIATANGGRTVHLFDTFDGLPAPGAAERRHLSANQYRSAVDGVRAFLAELPNAVVHQGLFPDTAADLAGRRFSFVHLDVDLKSSTRACLDWFYPRMVDGGVILTHDYSLLDGVRDAFTEFLADKPERAVELPTSQAMVIRRAGAADPFAPGFTGVSGVVGAYE